LREAGVVLAAGLGRRLGRGPKAYLRIGGESLLERALSLLRQAGVDRIAAVLPPSERDAGDGPAGVLNVHNPDPDSGPCASATIGLEALDGDAPVELLVLHHVDHAAVTAADLEALLEAARAAPPETARVVPTSAGRSGHPVVLLGPGLEALRDVSAPAETTLREVLQAAGTALRVPAGPGVLRNLNTPADLSSVRTPKGAAQ